MFANSKVVAQVTAKIVRRFKHDSNTTEGAGCNYSLEEQQRGCQAVTMGYLGATIHGWDMGIGR